MLVFVFPPQLLHPPVICSDVIDDEDDEDDEEETIETELQTQTRSEHPVPTEC